MRFLRTVLQKHGFLFNYPIWTMSARVCEGHGPLFTSELCLRCSQKPSLRPVGPPSVVTRHELISLVRALLHWWRTADVQQVPEHPPCQTHVLYTFLCDSSWGEATGNIIQFVTAIWGALLYMLFQINQNKAGLIWGKVSRQPFSPCYHISFKSSCILVQLCCV